VEVAETTRHVRALFISDVHLGSRACKAAELLDFLRHHDADTIYLASFPKQKSPRLMRSDAHSHSD
jgi:DNA polymerase II small subunit/DNA polymerase delta subunit B